MKIFYLGRQINGRFDSFKAAAKRAVRKTIQASAVVAVLAIAFAFGGAFYSTDTIIVSADTQTVTAPSPIMDRIADCESGNGKPGTATQFRKGQVLISINSNGTYDQGMYQINSIHNAEASALGYDLATTEGNTAFAKYLYANKGTGDWSSSAKCWSK